MTNKTNRWYRQIEVDGAAVIDTIQDGVRQQNMKHFISSFQGDGTLEVSDDKTNWRSTGKTSGDEIEPWVTLPRYARINAAGQKTVHLIAL